MDEKSKKQALDELERKQALLNQRINAQRDRINDRFDKEQAQLHGKLNSRQEQIIVAALELLTETGLNELSLRDIAKKLDMKAPTLYWYFKSKSELIDYMAEAMLSREFDGVAPRTKDEPWQGWLAGYMGKLRKAMLAYPDGGRVVAGAHLYPAKTLAQIFGDSTSSLISAGIDQKAALTTVMTAVHFTFGFVIEEQSGPSQKKLDSINKVNGREVARTYPELAQAADEYMSGADREDRAYAAGLQLIIKGSEAK